MLISCVPALIRHTRRGWRGGVVGWGWGATLVLFAVVPPASPPMSFSAVSVRVCVCTRACARSCVCLYFTMLCIIFKKLSFVCFVRLFAYIPLI